MTIRAVWDNEEHTTLCQVFQGPWTLEEYYASVDEMDVMLASAKHPVDVIVDLTATHFAPRNLLTAMRYADKKLKHYEGGRSVIITPSPIIHSTMDLARKLGLKTAQSLFSARTLQEGRSLLGKAS